MPTSKNTYVILVQAKPPTARGYEMSFIHRQMTSGLGYTDEPAEAAEFDDLEPAWQTIRKWRECYGETQNLIAVSGPASQWTLAKRNQFLYAYQAKDTGQAFQLNRSVMES